LRSTDSGQTWINVAVPGGLTEALRAISCASADVCIAVASNPAGESDPTAAAIGVATADGGNSWSPISLPAGTAAVETVTCPGPNACSAAGAGATPISPSFVVGTASNGVTWTPEQAPGGLSDVAAMTCADEQHCVAVGRK
jgi:photosystem II stability/assembly factor-like uncharacterized protein